MSDARRQCQQPCSEGLHVTKAVVVSTGTQSTRVFLFDVDQIPVASHQITLNQIIPEAGWCEHDPMQIWTDVQLCIVKACEVSHWMAALTHSEFES